MNDPSKSNTWKIKATILAGVLIGILLGLNPSVFAGDSTSLPLPIITYGTPNAQTAVMASSANYATNAGKASYATNANHANTANSATSCTGGTSLCGGSGVGSGTIQYQGIYGTRQIYKTSCGGTVPTTPTLAQAQAWYSSKSLVPGNYVKNPGLAAGCWKHSRWGGNVYVSGGLKTYYYYPRTSYSVS